jgi:hypothetical protein
MSRPVPVALVLVLLTSCAHKAPPPPAETPAATPAAPAANLPPLPRSSIAAVLEHREELALTDEQVRQLIQLDQERDKADATMRDQSQKKSAGQGNASGGGSGVAPRMGGRGMGGMGRMGGGGMGRRGGARSGDGQSGDRPTLQERIDDDDTKAFLAAEPIFDESQRDRACEIAEDYREKRWERQQTLAAQKKNSASK